MLTMRKATPWLPAAEKAPELYWATVSWLEEQVEIAVKANAAGDSETLELELDGLFALVIDQVTIDAAAATTINATNAIPIRLMYSPPLGPARRGELGSTCTLAASTSG